MKTNDWAREYFERGYAQRWGLPAPSDHVRKEAGGLWDLLGLSPASRVVDIACGHGRHALAIAERGPEVIGIDVAVTLLNRARDLATASHTGVRWIRGDMRSLPIQSESVGAVLVMDAFGLFETDAEHEAVLREAARVLMTGGRLALKVVNGGPILAAFRETDREERDGAVVSISRALTRSPPRMTERIIVSGSRGSGEYERHQRLYTTAEVCAMLEHAGLSVLDVYASPNGDPFEAAVSSTMWIVGERAGVVAELNDR